MSAALFKLKPIEKVELVPGHLVKEIIMKGTGESPVKGNTVTAHYTGVLTNGEKFDSSRDRGKPFQFKIGIGQVIQSWDVGMLSMKVGERAVLTSSSEYAYGEDGAPPVIPPNATLVFDVELIKISK
jgi:peptidylprolyl isomerase